MYCEHIDRHHAELSHPLGDAEKLPQVSWDLHKCPDLHEGVGVATICQPPGTERRWNNVVHPTAGRGDFLSRAGRADCAWSAKRTQNETGPFDAVYAPRLRYQLKFILGYELR